MERQVVMVSMDSRLRGNDAWTLTGRHWPSRRPFLSQPTWCAWRRTASRRAV